MHSWDDFPVLPTEPVTARTEPAKKEIHVGSLHYALLPDNGWGATIAWEAGPELAGRIADDVSAYHVVERTRAGNSRVIAEQRTVPRTEEDQDVIEESVNDYLAEAGIPPRPRGFAWYLKVPPTRSGLKELERAIIAKDTTGLPVDVRRVARTALADFGRTAE
ncbi:hypothetical protein C8D88_1011224 [Lentzea atacamensis]|uniref:Uncharacterized protein n=1 Tax=Lentzea atacamensis TaxID=531938 RepID=A0A316ID06_9PSEU|nr:DUF5956 family protein [Lentzea atacamensis]PWK91191.1 hypothetical protein C8D88_1011224 [Lentzea atacamensis]